MWLYAVFVSPIPERTVGNRCFTRPNVANHCGGILSLRVVKAIVRKYAKHPPQLLLALRGSVSFTSGPEEIGAIIAELVMIGR